MPTIPDDVLESIRTRVDIVELVRDFVPQLQRAGRNFKARCPFHQERTPSFIVTPEKLQTMGLPEDAIPHGWWVGFQINDDKQWDDVKTGKRTAFSIHGAGRRVEKSL